MAKRGTLYKHIVVAMLFALFFASCASVRYSGAVEEYNKGEYYKASVSLKKLYRKTDYRAERARKAEIAGMLAHSYDKLMIWPQASAYYQNAIRYNHPDTTLVFALAKSRLKEGKYREAIKVYNEILKSDSLNIEAINGLNSALKAEEWKKQGSRYEIHSFNIINSRKADFSPAIGTKQDELYFTTSNDKATGATTSNITGTKFCDIWVTRKDEKGNWQRPESAGEKLNTEADEGTPYFSPDGSQMFYTGCEVLDNGVTRPTIYVSTRSDATWNKGAKIHISKDTLFVYAHPAVSPDARYLYFVSNRPGGYGGYDIWRGFLNNNEVTELENLGPEINSKGNEMFPSFSPDGTLYFSSDGKQGLGALDIYSARLDEWNQWHVSHLGAPINSPSDDFSMTFFTETTQEQEGFFSSNRNNAKGYDNIYSFVLPSVNIRITGTVFNNDSLPVPNAIVRVVGRNGMNYKSVSKPDGTYEVSIEPSTEYVMMSGKTGFLNRSAHFMSDADQEDADYEVNFYLPSVSTPVVIDNVNFDYNKSTLRQESFASLDELVQILNDNPYTQIELSSHTDRIGTAEYNQQLSKRRADSVCQYLIKQGINPSRLVPAGYGKDKPFIIDETTSSHYGFPIEQVLTEDYILTLEPELQQVADQLNRRTEFKVLTTTFGIE